MKRKNHEKSGTIKTFWFDLGNVILFFNFKPAYEALSRHTPYQAERIARYFSDHPTLEADVDKGKIPARELFRIISTDLKVEGLAFAEFCSLWNRIFKPNRPVINLVKTLKKRGFRLVLISNTNRLHWDFLARNYPVLRQFHKHVLSFRLGVRKPGRRIYQEALRASRARAHEIIYIDDRQDLTGAARRNHGVESHTYETFGGLWRELRRMGLQGPQ